MPLRRFIHTKWLSMKKKSECITLIVLDCELYRIVTGEARKNWTGWRSPFPPAGGYRTIVNAAAHNARNSKFAKLGYATPAIPSSSRTTRSSRQFALSLSSRRFLLFGEVSPFHRVLNKLHPALNIHALGFFFRYQKRGNPRRCLRPFPLARTV